MTGNYVLSWSLKTRVAIVNRFVYVVNHAPSVIRAVGACDRKYVHRRCDRIYSFHKLGTGVTQAPLNNVNSYNRFVIFFKVLADMTKTLQSLHS